MKRYLGSISLILLLAAPVLAQTTVFHVLDHCSPWRGGWNADPNRAWLTNWPNANADGVLAKFDRGALLAAIQGEMAATGGWNAKIVVTQVDWIDTAPPADLAPVAASVDVDPSTLVWLKSYAYNAGGGSWRFDGTNYANFASAALAGAAAGNTYVATGSPWQGVWKPLGIGPITGSDYWNIEIDVPEYLIAHYLNNTEAEGLFVGAQKSDGRAEIFGNGQWGGHGSIRVVIEAAPTAAPWLNASAVILKETMALTEPTRTIPVTMTNAGSGTLGWTAAEAPAVDWLSLSDATGGDGDVLQVNLDVSGLAVGTYTTNIEFTAPAAANSVTLPVTVSVVPDTLPIISLNPASVTFTGMPNDSTPPASQSVLVSNVGLGTMQWSASEAPDVAWLTISDASGSGDGSFTLNVDHAGLTHGVYTTTVNVTDPTAMNSPQQVEVVLQVREQDADIVRANSYDDAWEDGADGWAAEMWHMQLNGTGKTDGFIVNLGDSISYANPFGQWARHGAGKTPADVAISNWMHSSEWGDGTNNSRNGWYLNAYDVAGRNGSFTARSSITSGGYVSGWGGLPSIDQMFTPGFTNPDGKQYNDALIAVVLLGTNDASSTVGNTEALRANLNTIVDRLLNVKVIPVLTTIPPRRGRDANVANFNAAIRDICQTRKLPLIDYHAEIMRRRPGQSWDRTLMASDGVHPSASFGGFTASSNPYANDGEALSHSGYLLRGWLTVQKIAEVKAKVLDVRSGDANRDGSIDVIDLLRVARSFGKSQGETGYDQRCDFNGDNSVNAADLLILASVFGT